MLCFSFDCFYSSLFCSIRCLISIFRSVFPCINMATMTKRDPTDSCEALGCLAHSAPVFFSWQKPQLDESSARDSVKIWHLATQKSPDHQTALLIQIIFTLFEDTTVTATFSVTLQEHLQENVPQKNAFIFYISLFPWLPGKHGRRVVHGHFTAITFLIPLPLHPHLSASSLCKSTRSCLLSQCSCTVF